MKVSLSDISHEIINLAFYNLRQSSVWYQCLSIDLYVSDMFENITNSPFDIYIFNPPQTPFQYSHSRIDKNGGIHGIKYY